MLAELDAMRPPPPERILFEEDPPTDAEAITRLVQVEADIAGSHALRAQLIALVAAQRPAKANRPAGRPGAATAQSVAAEPDVVPEVLEVSEWLAHELQMAHPYSFTAAQDLVETSLACPGGSVRPWLCWGLGGSTTGVRRSSPTCSAPAAPRSHTPCRRWCCPRHRG